MKNALLFTIMGCLLMCAAYAQSNEKEGGESIDLSILFQEDEYAKKWDYFIYPVPAVDEINVKITKGHVTIHQVMITDEFGNELMQLTDLDGDKLKIDISELPEGKYFMQIIPDDKQSVRMKRFYVSN